MVTALPDFSSFQARVIADAQADGSLAALTQQFDDQIALIAQEVATVQAAISAAAVPGETVQIYPAGHPEAGQPDPSQGLVKHLTDAVLAETAAQGALAQALIAFGDLGADLLQAEAYLAQFEYELAQCLSDIAAGLSQNPPLDITDLQGDLNFLESEVGQAVTLTGQIEAAILVRQTRVDALHLELEALAASVVALDEAAVTAYADSIRADASSVYVVQEAAARAALADAQAAVLAGSVDAATAARDAAQVAFNRVLEASAPLEEAVGAVEGQIGALVDQAIAGLDHLALLTAANDQAALTQQAQLQARAARDLVRAAQNLQGDPAVQEAAIAAAEAEEARLLAAAAYQDWLLAVAEAQLERVEAGMAIAEAAAMAELPQIVALEVAGHALVEFVHAVEAIVLEELPAVVGELLPPDLFALVPEGAPADLEAALTAAIAALQAGVVEAQALGAAAPAAVDPLNPLAAAADPQEVRQAAAQAAVDAAAVLARVGAATADVDAAVAVAQADLAAQLAAPAADAVQVAAQEALIAGLQALAEAAEGQLLRVQAIADAALVAFQALGVDPNGPEIAAAEAAAELNADLVAAFNAADAGVVAQRAVVDQARAAALTAAQAARDFAGIEPVRNAAEARAAADLALAVAAFAEAELALAVVIAAHPELALIEAAGGTIHFGPTAGQPLPVVDAEVPADPAVDPGATVVVDPQPEALPTDVVADVVVPVEPPAQPTEAPAQPTETPVQVTEAPAEPTTAPQVQDPAPVLVEPVQLRGTAEADVIEATGVAPTQVLAGPGFDVLDASVRLVAEHLQVEQLGADGVSGAIVDANGIVDQFQEVEAIVLSDVGGNSLSVSEAIGALVLDFNGAERGRGVVVENGSGERLTVSGVDRYSLSGSNADRIRLGGKLDADGEIDANRADDNYQISWDGQSLTINGRSTGDASFEGVEWVEFEYQDVNNASGGIRKEFYVKEFAQKALSLGLSVVKQPAFAGDAADEIVLRQFGNAEERAGRFYLQITAESLREARINTLDFTVDLGETFGDVFALDPEQIVLTGDLAVQRQLQVSESSSGGLQLRFTGAGLEALGAGESVGGETVLGYVGLSLRGDINALIQAERVEDQYGFLNTETFAVPLQFAADATVDQVVWDDLLSLRDLGGQYALQTLDLEVMARAAAAAMDVEVTFDLGTYREVLKPGEGSYTNLVRAGDTILQRSSWRNDGEFSLVDLKLTAIGDADRDVAAEVTAWFAEANASELSELGWSAVAGGGERVEVMASFAVVGAAGSVIDTREVGFELSADGGYSWKSTEMEQFASKHLVTYQSDVNYDGAVTMKDLASLNAGAAQGGDAHDVDVNYDGVINMLDLSLIDQEWGASLHGGDGGFVGSERITLEELFSQGGRSWDSSGFADQNAIETGELEAASEGHERGYTSVLTAETVGVMSVSLGEGSVGMEEEQQQYALSAV